MTASPTRPRLLDKIKEREKTKPQFGNPYPSLLSLQTLPGMYGLGQTPESKERAMALKHLFPGRGYHEELRNAIDTGDAERIKKIVKKQFAQIHDPAGQAIFLKGYGNLFPDIAAEDGWYEKRWPLIPLLEDAPARNLWGSRGSRLREELKLEAQVGSNYALDRKEREHNEAIKDALDDRYAIVSRTDMSDAILKLQESERRAEQEQLEKQAAEAQRSTQSGHTGEISTPTTASRAVN